MKKIIDLILKFKKSIIMIFLLATCGCVFLTTLVAVNYDLTKYLPSDKQSSVALNLVETEFGLSGEIKVVLENIDKDKSKEFYNDLLLIDNIKIVIFDINSIDSYNNNCAYYFIMVNGEDASEEALTVKDDIIYLIDNNYSEYAVEYSGSVFYEFMLKVSVMRETPIILLISLIVIIIILTLMCTSYLEPIIILLSIGIAIVINMGTNIFIEISFVTLAIAPILQLALAMDYSIIIIHSYRRYQKEGLSNDEAMKLAIKNSFKSIVCSGVTTITGLIALLFMSFSIGFDLGLVLMKGIVISLIVCFTLLPCLILVCDKLLNKAKKKECKISFKTLFKLTLSKARFVMISLLAILTISSFFIQSNSSFGFVDSGSDAPLLEENFTQYETILLIVKNDKSEDGLKKQIEFINKLSEFKSEDGSSIIYNYTGYTNTILQEYSIEDVSTLFNIDEELVEILYSLYYIDDTYSITLSNLISNISLLLNEDQYLKYFTEEQLTLINSYIYLLNNLEVEVNSNDMYNQLFNCGIDLTKNEVSAIYFSYGLDNWVNNPKLNVISFIDYTINNSERFNLSTDRLNSLITYQNLLNLYLSNDEYNFIELYDLLSSYISSNYITKDSVALIYSLNNIALNNNVKNNIYANNLISFLDNLIINNEFIKDILPNNIIDMINDNKLLLENIDSLLQSENYMRVLINVKTIDGSLESYEFIEYSLKVLEEVYNDDAYLAGGIYSTYDLKETFEIDKIFISLFTFISIFIVVAVTFRKISIPVMLLVVIECAIWFCFSISSIVNYEIFFISYIVVSCILMGATIDYAILMTSNYKEERKINDKKESLYNALNHSLPSIITSASILIICGFLIGIISTQLSIKSVGILLCQGTSIAFLIIVIILPSLLYTFDKLLIKYKSNTN